jgi:hypothetical protein
MDASLDENQLLAGIAYHEAGHAVSQHLFGFELQSLVADPERDSGRAEFQMSSSMRFGGNAVQFEATVARDRFLSHLIMLNQAGAIVQQTFCPASYRPENSGRDRRDIERYIRQRDRYASRVEREATIYELAGYTQEMLADERCVAAIHALATALIEHRRLGGDQAEAIIAQAIADTAASRRNMTGKIICPHCLAYQSRYEDYEEACRGDGYCDE